MSDPNGNPVGIDYAIFHTGGRLLASQNETGLYEDDKFLAALAVTTGEENQDPSRLFVNPPFYAALFAPLANAPYRTGFAIWTGIGLVALGLGLRLLGAHRWALVATAALLFYPVFVAFRLGQNSFVSLLLLADLFRVTSEGQAWLGGSCFGFARLQTSTRSWCCNLVDYRLASVPQCMAISESHPQLWWRSADGCCGLMPLGLIWRISLH